MPEYATGHTSIFQQIDHSRCVVTDLVEIVVVHAKVVTSDCSDIVRLRSFNRKSVTETPSVVCVYIRVSYPKVVRKSDTLASQPGKVWIASRFVVVCVLEPDFDISVEHSSRYVRLAAPGGGSSGLSSVDSRCTRSGVDVWLVGLTSR